MTNFLKTGLVLSGVLVLTGLMGLSQHANAADLDPSYIPNDTTNVEYGSGWYLRGHLGFSQGNSENQNFNANGGVGAENILFTRQNDDDGYSMSVGAGYIFNPYFRMDATMDSHSARQWTGFSQLLTPAGIDTGDRYVRDTSSYELTNYGVNAYFSLGSVSGITPYIGAGVGLADVKWSGHTFTGLCFMDPGEACDGYGAHSGGTAQETSEIAVGTFEEFSNQAFTYSLIGGFDYRIDKNWVLDFEYKYTHVSDGITLQGTSAAVAVNSVSDEFDTHDFRIGVRYEIW